MQGRVACQDLVGRQWALGWVRKIAVGRARPQLGQAGAREGREAGSCSVKAELEAGFGLKIVTSQPLRSSSH